METLEVFLDGSILPASISPIGLVGKCRFWNSSIFRIRFWCDDVTSTRSSPNDLWRFRRTHDGRRYPRRSSVSVMVGDISGALPMCPGCLRPLRYLQCVSDISNISDSGTFLFLESDFGATTSLVFVCHGVSLWYIEPCRRVKIYLVSTSNLITTVSKDSHHPILRGSGADVIITPSSVKSFQIIGDIMMYWQDLDC